MESLTKKLNRLLKHKFPPPDKIRLRDEDGIIGTIISRRFKGLDSLERVNMIWDYLNEHISPEERRRIVIIIGVTPTEEIAHLA